MTPELGYLSQIQIELALATHQIQALGKGLHHAVLNTVVDHLGKVTRTCRPNMRPSPVRSRGQRFEYRCYQINITLTAADHHAVALIQSPDPSGSTCIDKTDFMFSKQRAVSDGVVVVGITTIDNDIPGREHAGEIVYHPLRRLTGWQHEPDNLWGFELFQNLGYRRCRQHPLLLGQRLDNFR